MSDEAGQSEEKPGSGDSFVVSAKINSMTMKGVKHTNWVKVYLTC